MHKLNVVLVLLAIFYLKESVCLAASKHNGGRKNAIRSNNRKGSSGSKRLDFIPSSSYSSSTRCSTPLFLQGGSIIGSGSGGGGNDNIWLQASNSNDDNSSSNTGNTSLFSAIILAVSKLISTYSNVLTKYPWTTKILSSGFIGGMGDVLIQFYEGRNTKDFSFNLRRFLVFTTVTGFYIAPVIHIWFNWLAAMPMPKAFLQPGKVNNVIRAMIMMVADQTVGATVITIGFFYAFELVQKLFPPYASGQMDLLSFIAAGELSTKNNLWETLVANWYCWPIINFVNFLVIPINYRVLFSNFAAVFWNMFLSSIANREAK